jgi:hypothetical protein
MRLGRTGPEPATCGRLGRRLHAMVAVLVLKGVELKMIELKQVHCQGPVRILLVDDQPACLASLGSVLTCNGYIVDTAVDGLDALMKLKRSLPTLLQMVGLGCSRRTKRCAVPVLRDGAELLYRSNSRDGSRYRGPCGSVNQNRCEQRFEFHELR